MDLYEYTVSVHEYGYLVRGETELHVVFRLVMLVVGFLLIEKI